MRSKRRRGRCGARSTCRSAGAPTSPTISSGCAPAGADGQLKAISLVCKVVEADGRPAVKLSDNPNKALGSPEEIERYQRVFGVKGMTEQPVEV